MAADTPPDPTRHRRIKSVFLAALALPESERAAFLDERCASDAAMRAEVDELLRLERGGGATLEAGCGLREAIDDLREEPLPERYGPYRRSQNPKKSSYYYPVAKHSLVMTFGQDCRKT